MRRPFYGQGTPPPIARMDMRAATEPGRAFRDMFLNLGKVAGDALKSYGEKKKAEEDRKALTEQTKNFLINAPEVARQLGVSGNENVSFEEAVGKAADAWSKDPKSFETLKGLVSFQEQLRNNQLQQTANQINIASSAATMARNAETDNLEAEKRQGQQQFDNLFFKGLGNETEPGEFMQMIQQAREDGVLNDQGLSLARNQFMKLQERDQEALERKANLEDQISLLQEKESLKSKPVPPRDPIYKERALTAINDAINLVETNDYKFLNTTTGTLGQILSKVGGTDAFDLGSALDTITASVGFDRLQKMRDESPTGGALGQVSERELSLLNASLGSIKQGQSQEQLLKNLKDIQTHYQNAVAAIKAQQSGYSFGNIDEADKFLANSVISSNQATREQLLEEEKRLKEMLYEREGVFDSPPVPITNVPGVR